MTILGCQKRHHEKHYVSHSGWPNYEALVCDGRPGWPYPRPKPPRIRGDRDASIDYQLAHNVIVVYCSLAIAPFESRWWVDWVDDTEYFPTFHEAVHYAQKLAQERNKQRGTYQGN